MYVTRISCYYKLCTLLSWLGGFYLIVHVVMFGFIVYFDVRCKCAVCVVVRWYCVHGSSCLVHVFILCILSSYLYVWSCYVFVLYWLYWCFTYMPGCRLEVSIRKVLLWPATSAQVFLGFPVSNSKCWFGSQNSKFPLHASHVALPK
jgi:hypothetical protein